MLEKKPTVVVIPAGFSGCAFWRLRNPIECLRRHYTDIDIKILNLDMLAPMQVMELIRDSNLLVMQAPGSPEAVNIIEFARSLNIPVLIDYDDYSFDLSPYNPRYKDLGLEEAVCKKEDGTVTWEWKDWVNGFDLRANRGRYNAFIDCMKMASGVTTTTPYIAKNFEKFNPNVHILPNSIDFKKWVYHPKPDKFKDQVRVGWFGGDSHFKDLELIIPSIEKIMIKYPQVKLVLMTPDRWPQIFGKLPQDRVEYHPWADLSYYTLALSSMYWDIGLCPIEVNEFGKCKSNIKWQEYGALKVPSVLTDTVPYNVEPVKHNLNALLAPNDKFFEAIEELVIDPVKRATMALEAHEAVKRHYDLDQTCFEWYKLYKNTCNFSFPQQSPRLVNKLVSTLQTLVPITKG